MTFATSLVREVAVESKLYIFDLDGTLALTDHRQHFLDGPRGRRRWREYFAACDKDEPNWPVIEMLYMINMMGHDWLIFSGRSDEVREKTLEWLHSYLPIPRYDLERRLYMRKAGDYTDDAELKRSWLRALGTRPTAVFDDRDKVVKMWREEGIPCFQVNYGDF